VQGPVAHHHGGVQHRLTSYVACMGQGLEIDLFASQHAAPGGGVTAQQLSEERDYRRRTKKYRARNVHLTKRTPIQVRATPVAFLLVSVTHMPLLRAQIARDFINNRMEEMVAIIEQMQPAATASSSEDSSTSSADRSGHKESSRDGQHGMDEKRETRHNSKRKREEPAHRRSRDEREKSKARRKDRHEEERRPSGESSRPTARKKD
jgi:hypothetical protein